MTRTCFTETACAADRVGNIVLRGRFGGAVCSHYRIISVKDGVATYEPVKAVSFKNEDGTYSHRYETDAA